MLHDANFGDLCVGGIVPESLENLFISIESFNSQALDKITSPDYYDFIIVDEFHHAAAKSYQRLLEYYKPKILLGLTATPERMDGKSILPYFDDRIAAEIRLPEAIDRKLLCPFHYFGVSDNVDLNDVKWSRGGYDKTALSKLYTGYDLRVMLILKELNKYVADMDKVKGLGFCVSKEHAEYMAQRFNQNNIPSIALTADSKRDERDSAQRKLANGGIKFIFTVAQIDQYNTSIDQKIDGAIAAYLAGIRVSKTTEERFPVGAGEKAVLCWSDKITNMAFGKATLDFNFQITDFFNGPDRAANNESAGSITMTRTGNSNYELFNCNASGNKFKYYTKNANIELTGAWNFIQRADYSGTTDSSNYKLRWHGGAFGITTLNRASATAGSSNYYDDRFNKFGFATIYGTQLNYGNAWNGGVGASERIYSSTTSVNINVDDSNKVLWIMDNATAN